MGKGSKKSKKAAAREGRSAGAAHKEGAASQAMRPSGALTEELVRLYEEVITVCCAPELPGLYQQLPREGQENVVRALRDSCMMQLANFEATAQANGKTDRLPPFMLELVFNGPVAKALRYECNGERQSPMGVMYVTSNLGNWGTRITKPKHEIQADVEKMLADRQQHRSNSAGQVGKEFMTTGSSLTKGAAAPSVSLDSLKDVTIDDLRLFQAAKGCVLRGTVFTTPVCLVGASIFMEDSQGTIVRVALYNFAPGVSAAQDAQPYMHAKFAPGTKIAIIEPYYKIANDGYCTVRVDTPTEVVFVDDKDREGRGQDAPLLIDAVQSTKALLAQGNAAMAMDTMMAALQHEGNEAVQHVATLFNNRAQAHVRLGDAPSALRDAATVLLLRPRQEKAWLRYCKALDAMGLAKTSERAAAVAEAPAAMTTDAGSSGHVAGPSERPPRAETEAALSRCLTQLPKEAGHLEPDSGSCVQSEVLKEKGNELFKGGEFAGAVRLYTSAIAQATAAREVADACGQLAECGMSCSSYHSALSASAAAANVCSAVSADDADFQELRVGVCRLLLQALAVLMDGGSSPGGTSKKAPKAQKASPLVQAVHQQLRKLCDTSSHGLKCPTFAVGESADLVERGLAHKAMPGKGRALVATSAFKKGQVLFVNRPLLNVAAKDLDDNYTTVLSVRDKTMYDPAHGLLASQLSFLVSRDARVAQVVAALDHNLPVESSRAHGQCSNGDGAVQQADLQLVHLPDMLQTLSSSVLPLLPQLWAYFPAREYVNLSADRVGRVCAVNCHGEDPEMAFQGKSKTCLIPLVSLMNHSRNPNCTLVMSATGQDKCDLVGTVPSLVVAHRDGRAGEELTVSYSLDEAAVQRKWAISS